MGRLAGASATRVSDAERERVLRALREELAQGRLSDDTFVHRVDAVLRSRTREELASTTDGLPPHPRLTDRLLRAVSAVSTATARVQAAWDSPRLPRLCLPHGPARVHTVGRSPACGLVIGDPSVSRLHAEFHREPDGWVVVDLGSTNGTWLNGRRIGQPRRVRTGDKLAFAMATFILSVDREPGYPKAATIRA